MIRQGDLYWADFDQPRGSEPGYRHPVVVVQNNLFNDIPIKTVIVCMITSNPKYAKAPNKLAPDGVGNPLVKFRNSVNRSRTRSGVGQFKTR